ncbi:MAG: 1-acyl-sn-glycerol-3-phosphate acyltransferase [Sphingobacteriales bacterium]|nr:MAG: 1-acyl-sn-glycerol-3-phosphate acyltransferase [Sphingobacteriales bacterium]
MLRKLLQPIYTAIVLLTFVICLLTAFPFFLLFGSMGTAKGRKIIWHIVSTWAKGWLWFIGMPLRRLGSVPNDGKYVFVANHISYLDTIDVYAAIPTYFRTLAKIEMSRIPIFGFVYKQVTILVDRESAQGRARSMRLMWMTLRNECSISIFPEGTFNETDAPLKHFYDGAFRLAISAQIPIVPLLFPDTVKRWHYSGWYKLWPGRNRAIFLDPVPVDGLELRDLPMLKEKVCRLMETELAKYGYPKS